MELLCGAEAAEILPDDERRSCCAVASRLTFDKLILTAGAHPFVPPHARRAARGRPDRAILAGCPVDPGRLRPGMKCVCIGGGVLGVETAGALARRGADVTLLEGHGWLMPRQLNQAAGRRLATHIEKIGVQLRTQAKIKEIVGDERVGGVLLEDGTTLPADLVVITTGVRPNSFLARRAGLEVGAGVVVDEHWSRRTRTSWRPATSPSIAASSTARGARRSTWAASPA